MTKSNALKSGVSRVDARLLLKALAYIDQNKGAASPDLEKLLNLSRPTVMRLIANAREQYGVDIVWRRDNSMPSHGEYLVKDWGVFCRENVLWFVEKRSR